MENYTAKIEEKMAHEHSYFCVYTYTWQLIQLCMAPNIFIMFRTYNVIDFSKLIILQTIRIDATLHGIKRLYQHKYEMERLS